MVGLLLTACGGVKAPAPVPALPDGPVVQAEAPRVVLEAGAASPSPGVRGAALRWLTLLTPPDKLIRWAMQGMYDPDPWVQGRVIDALVARIEHPEVVDLLLDFCGRGSADPYVRARAGAALMEAGHADRLDGMKQAWSGQPEWRAAPLAVVALRLGERGALAPLYVALARSSFRDDLFFLYALRHLAEEPDVQRAVGEGLAFADESMELAFALAQLSMGLPEGDASLRALLSSSSGAARWDAFEAVLAAPEPLRSSGVAAALRGQDRLLKKTAAFVRKPSAGKGRALMATGDGVVQVIVLREDPNPTAALLATGLASGTPEVRREAIKAVERAARLELRAAVANMLTDEVEVVRVEAAGAIEALTNR